MLTKFGVSYINQDLFLKDFAKGDQVHIEGLITRVRSAAPQHHQATGISVDGAGFEPNELADLRSSDYFSEVHQQIRASGATIDT